MYFFILLSTYIISTLPWALYMHTFALVGTADVSTACQCTCAIEIMRN